MSKYLYIELQIMKMSLKLFFFTIIFYFLTPQNSFSQVPYVTSLGIETTFGTRSYSVDVLPHFGVGLNDYFWLSAGLHFGSECGYYNKTDNEARATSRIKREMTGDEIKEIDLNRNSELQYGAKMFINFIPNKSQSEALVLSIGGRYTYHPETMVSYRVKSTDGSNYYYDNIDLDIADSFWAFAPEIGINQNMWGLFYAYQKLPKDIVSNKIGVNVEGKILHTLGVRINFGF